MPISQSSNKPIKLRWANLSTAEARDNKVDIKAQCNMTTTPWGQLALTEQQTILFETFTANLTVEDPGTNLMTVSFQKTTYLK